MVQLTGDLVGFELEWLQFSERRSFIHLTLGSHGRCLAADLSTARELTEVKTGTKNGWSWLSRRSSCFSLKVFPAKSDDSFDNQWLLLLLLLLQTNTLCRWKHMIKFMAFLTFLRMPKNHLCPCPTPPTLKAPQTKTNKQRKLKTYRDQQL